MDMWTLCQFEAIPHKAEGIEPFTTDMRTPCQVRVTPHKSEGIKPFTMDTKTPCQVRVTPHKSEGIEPFTMVNTPPCQVRAMPSHLINTPSGPLKVTSSVSAQVSASTLPCVTPISSPTYIQLNHICIIPCNVPFVSCTSWCHFFPTENQAGNE